MSDDIRIIKGFRVKRHPDGRLETLGPANEGPQPVTVGRVNPAAQYEAPKAAAQVQGQNLDNTGQAITNSVNAGTARTTIQTNQAPSGFMWVDPNDPAKGVMPIPGYTPEGEGGTSDKAIAAKRILQMLDGEDGIVSQYERDFAGGGLGAIAEYPLPFGANATAEKFDTKSNALLPFAKKLLRTPGEGSQSDKEAQDYRDQLPRSSFRDATNEQLIADLRATALSVLESEGVDVSTYDQATGSFAPPPPNAMNYTRTDGGRASELGAADAGATERAIPYPDEMVAEHDALVQRLLANNNNRLPPDIYAREKAKLAARFQRATDPASDEAWAGQINEYIEGGGATIPTGLQPEREAMGAVDQARNAASQSFLGAGLIGAADALSYGSLQNIEPGKMSALANEGGWTQAGLTLGQVGGTVANTMGVGSIAGRAAARFAPQMLQGGKVGQFGRNLLGDTAYGAGYGEVTQGDALGGATQAAIGSTAGQGIGSIIGRGVSGVTSSPTVSRLRGQGIQPTFGQIMRGRATDNDTWSLAAGVEDVFANNGVTGSVVNSARARTLEQANNAALNIGARGKGYVKGFGEEGIGNLADLSDSAYDDALSGVSIPPVDPADLVTARQSGAAIDAARNRGDFGYVYDNQLTPVISGPQMSGEQIQDALRLLRGQSRSYSQAARGIAPDPAAQGVADALDMTQDAITGHVGRYAPEVVPALDEANSIYRNFKVLDDAAGRAMNDGGVFTGAQLGQAMKANNAKFGQRGFSAQTDSPFYQLQQDMQNVLPNQIPPTGVNAAPALAIGGAALGATGEATDNDYLRMGALATLPALAYTKPGQKAISTILLDRPDALRQFGESVRRRKGLFGSAAVPLALPLN